jgi:hypothetical protein
VVKEQVDVKGMPVDFELHLASHKGEAAESVKKSGVGDRLDQMVNSA